MLEISSMRSSHVLVTVTFAAAGCLAGCVIDDKLPSAGGSGDGTGGTGDTAGSGDTDTGSGDETPAGLNVALVVVDRDGAVMTNETFENRDDVYFSVQPANASKPVVAEDYVFQIVTTNGGVLVSDDGFACRLFHINERGLIDRVASAAGSNCEHELRLTSDGRLLVRAVPFAVPETNGNASAKLTLKIANLATCRADDQFIAGLPGPFEIAAADRKR